MLFINMRTKGSSHLLYVLHRLQCSSYLALYLNKSYFVSLCSLLLTQFISLLTKMCEIFKVILHFQSFQILYGLHRRNRKSIFNRSTNYLISHTYLIKNKLCFVVFFRICFLYWVVGSLNVPTWMFVLLCSVSITFKASNVWKNWMSIHTCLK